MDSNDNNDNNDVNYKDTIVFSGGGIKGVSYMGSLVALNELNMYKHINTFAGTSVGGLVASLCVLGYTPDELKSFIINFKMDNTKCINFFGILLEYGIDNGSKLELVIKKLIAGKKYSENITLEELYNKTKKNLYLTATCVNDKKIIFLNHESSPKLPLYLAIRMTTAIPIFYTPVKYEGKYYIDGGCLNNYPISLFKHKLDKVIGLYLYDEENTVENINNIETYLSCVIQCLMASVYDTYINIYEQCTILIKLQSINPINYSVNEKEKENMCDIGYKCIMDKFGKINQ